jgi:rhodanese-related sulfurtransferase
MSPAAAREAEKLGYTNVKVYHAGLPDWTKRNPMALAPKMLKEAWFDKSMPIVVLDARPSDAAAKGFIPGAVSFPKADEAAVASLPDKKLKAPIVVYDEAGGKGNAEAVARALVAAGQNRAMVLVGGFEGWKAAGYAPATGAMAAKVEYVPKLKPGEISVDEFRKLVESTPADTVLLDVRSAADASQGRFKGALHIPVDELASRAGELPKDKRIVMYCNTGTLSEMGYHQLKPKGIPKLNFVRAIVVSSDGKAEIEE